MIRLGALLVFALAALLALALPAGMAADHQAKTISVLPTSKKVVALTFDCGADAGYTAKILRTLKREGVQASFGVTGEWVSDNRKLARRMVDQDEVLINHTFDHASWTGVSQGSGLSDSQRKRELRRANKEVVDVTGETTRPFFRPPYGDYDSAALRLLPKLGYDFNILWSTDSLGWAGASEDEIVHRVVDGLQPGAIYAFHVGSESEDGPALERVIHAVRRHGYRFATVADYLHG